MTLSNNDTAPVGKSSSLRDVWADGAAYEAYIGRWSRHVAREFIAWLEIAPNSRWLDVGCGSGALTQTILRLANPAHIQGIDRSAGFVAFAGEQVQDERARFDVGDAQALPVESANYDAVVSGLVLNFIPQPDLAIREMARAARAGGTIAAYVWDYVAGMQIMQQFWDAAVALDPQATRLAEAHRFPQFQPQPFADLFRAAGLHTVEVRAIEIATTFRDFDDYWSPFLGGTGPAPTYAMSLGEEQRTALREQLRQQLPVAADGSIPLQARAWAVRGVH